MPASPSFGGRHPELIDGVWRDGDFWYDAEAAQRFVDFCSKCIRHSIGEWAGKPFILEPWQERVSRAIFGWKRADGSRRFRTVYVEVGRKNGKSTWASAVAAYLLLADKEPGAEVYSAAADRMQASIVFEAAKSAIEASSVLKKRVKVFKRAITGPLNSSYKVLSADVKTKHGLSPSGIIFDELHAQPNRNLWDVLRTGMSARRQPLLFAITTAGWDRHSICWEQHDYAVKVASGIIPDDEFLGVIYSAPSDADWTKEETWRLANPNLGISKKLSYMEAECARAKESPAYENTFRQLELCQWTEQSVRWMPMEAWDSCGEKADEDSLEGEECWGGLDLSTTTDVAALALLFRRKDGGYIVVPKFWIPEENAELRQRRDRVPYPVWAKQGLVKMTEGDVIDYDVIRKDIGELGTRFDIKEIAADRWNASQIITQLTGDGFMVVPFGQGFASMAFPTKRLMELVLGKRIAHGGNPVLRWMASNVSAKKDAAGNLKPDKEKSTEKIDGIVAIIMALGRAEVNASEDEEFTGEVFSF